MFHVTLKRASLSACLLLPIPRERYLSMDARIALRARHNRRTLGSAPKFALQFLARRSTSKSSFRGQWQCEDMHAFLRRLDMSIRAVKSHEWDHCSPGRMECTATIGAREKLWSCHEAAHLMMMAYTRDHRDLLRSIQPWEETVATAVYGAWWERRATFHRIQAALQSLAWTGGRCLRSK